MNDDSTKQKNTNKCFLEMREEEDLVLHFSKLQHWNGAVVLPPLKVFFVVLNCSQSFAVKLA